MLTQTAFPQPFDTPPLIEGLLRHAEQFFGVGVVTFTLNEEPKHPQRRSKDHNTYLELEDVRFTTTSQLRNHKQEIFGTLYLLDWLSDEHNIAPEQLEHFSDLLAKALQIEQYKHHEYQTELSEGMIDPLTQLPRREFFEQQISHWIHQYTPENKQLAVLFVDVDHFKQLNDTWGHQFGDTLLKAVAERLRNNLRPQDLLSRWGGDEFVIVLPELLSRETVQSIAERLQRCLQKPFTLEHPVQISISIGISMFPEDGQDYETLLRAADLALLHSKQNGKKQSQWFTRELQQHSQERSTFIEELKQAFTNKTFELYYQPQINLETNRVCGYEALLRWQHPRLGLLTPIHFLPILHSLGLTTQIDQWVISQVIQRCANWQKIENQLQLSINISGQTFAQPELLSTIENLLEQHTIQPQSLWLEVSETALEKQQINTHTIQALGKLGVAVALDDFGIGTSNLLQLQQLAVKRLKIHRQFINNLEQPEKQILLQTMLYIAQQFAIEVVAQGIETQQQLSWLKQHNCQIVQGFLLSEPMLAETFLQRNRTHFT